MQRPASLLFLLLVIAVPAGAQEADESNTPRGAVRAFLDDARMGHWDAAAQHLSSTPGIDEAGRVHLARSLKAVIDTYLWPDLERISDQPEGKTDDHLPPNLEELGRVPSPSGSGTEPVRLVRSTTGAWLFSSTTVARIDAWYAELPDRWVREHLPEPLLRPGPRNVFWWQYIALTIFAMGSLVIGRFASWVVRKLLRLIARRSSTTFDDTLLNRLDGPVALLLATVVAHVLLPRLFLTRTAEAFVLSGLSAVRLVGVYWALTRTVDLATETVRSSTFVEHRPETKALLPLATRVAKVALTIAAGVVVLQRLGYPAGSLVAGLGIGGLAFALAAQKTVENLFGSVMLSLDQPFRPGDLVKVEDVTGVVESVGLRSTRIRTPERTIVTIPNGRLADLRIESFAQRDRLKVAFTLALAHDTPPAVVRALIADLRLMLSAHPQRHVDEPRIYLSAIAASGIELDLIAWFDTCDLAALQEIRQDVLVGALELLEKHGTALAAATARTVKVDLSRSEASGQQPLAGSGRA